jgi:hypothetical protein
MPVETNFDEREEDFIYGGRVFQRISRKAEAGLSFLKEDNGKETYRKELGIDLWVRPAVVIEVQGQSFYNDITNDWMDHSYNILLRPVDRFSLTAFFSKVDYEHAFSATTLSAFLPALLGEGEELTKVGGKAEYVFVDVLTLTADYSRYEYELMGSADYYGGLLSVLVYDVDAGISLHRMNGETNRLKYLESRAYAARSLGDFRVTGDAINVHYDQSFRNIDDVYSVSGTLTYRFRDYLKGAVNLDYRRTPDFTRDIRALFKIMYNFEKII